MIFKHRVFDVIHSVFFAAELHFLDFLTIFLLFLLSSFRVAKHMSAGNEYEFRVIALNKGGESEPSPVSKAVLAKIRFIKPKINRDVFAAEKTIHSGQTLRYGKR